MPQKDLAVFSPSGTRHPEKKCQFYFPSPGHIWDGPQWFISPQNDKMHTVACNQRRIWALNAPEGSPKRPPKPQNGPFWPILGTKIRDFFRSKSFFSQFHCIKHPQKPYFRPRDHFLTTRVPLFVTFLAFKIQSRFAPKGLGRFQPFRHPAPGRKHIFNFFPKSKAHLGWSSI